MMSVALLLVLGFGALTVMNLKGGARAPAPGGEGAPGERALPAKPVEITVTPLFPSEEAEEVETRIREDMAKFKGIVDGQPIPDPEPYEYLLDEVTKNYRVINLLPAGFARDPDPKRFQDDPGAQRGRLVLVSGELLSLRSAPYEGANRLVDEVRLGVVRTAGGVLWSFTQPVPNRRDPNPVQPGEGWVRVRGVFYKAWDEPDPAEAMAPRRTLHLVLQHPVERDFPPVAHREIDPAWLEMVADGTEEEMWDRTYPALYHLLNFVHNLGEEGFERWGKEQQARFPGERYWPPPSFTNKGPELVKGSQVWRFRPVSFTGILKKPARVLELQPNPGNVEDLYQAFLIADDLRPVWFYSTRSFVDLGFREDERVRVEGIYLRRMRYQTRSATGKPDIAPVVVAARVVRAEFPPGGPSRDLIFIVGGLALLLLVMLTIVLAQGRWEDRRPLLKRREPLLRGAAPGARPAEGGPGDAP